jgi:uncharacterized membrane protein YcaP (DUF421 family)
VPESLWSELTITGPQFAAVAISTSVLFWVFSGLMAWFGQRLRLRVSVATLALMTVVGAVTARSMLGESPKLMAGLVALAVLFAWEFVFVVAGRRWRWRHPSARARAVVVDGRLNEAALRLAGIRSTDLWIRLRRAGVTELAKVRYAIVEGDGSITVIRHGQRIDPELLTGVALQ